MDVPSHSDHASPSMYEAVPTLEVSPTPEALAGEAHGNIVRALVHTAIAALTTGLLILFGPRVLPSHISDTLFASVSAVYFVIALGLYWKARHEWNEAKDLYASIGRRE